jgi:fluoride ion exporter CrcB/FEX
MKWTFILAVAAGGSLGSVARYLVAIGFGRLLGSKFPWGTLFINVSGSFLIGLFVGLFAICPKPREYSLQSVSLVATPRFPPSLSMHST